MMAIVALIAAGALIFSHMAPFPFLLEAFRPSRSVWRIPQPDAARTVYLTFDDGPNVAWTPKVLDALRDSQASATFFLIDEHITADTEWVVRRIADEGHAIALHSGSRKPMIMSPEILALRLEQASDRIRAITGREPCRLFRPHAGWRSATMYDALARLDFRLAGWSWGMWDWSWWQTPEASAVAKRLERKASPGDIIVIHDGHHKDPRADRSHAGAAVRLLVPALRSRGYGFAPLCNQSPTAADARVERLVAAAVAQTGAHVTYDGAYRRIGYPNGDVPQTIGVCTDLVIRAYRGIGVDLQVFVHEDMKRAFRSYPQLWKMSGPDPNIDHRRVPNLQTFFRRAGAAAPISHETNAYRAGDLVTWMLPGNLPHIGIVSSEKSPEGTPLVVHNIGRGPEIDDVLFKFTITGHYRYMP